MAQPLEDIRDITTLMAGWLHRDLMRWDELAGLFHLDATVEITWFRGTAQDFITGSQRMGVSRLTSRHLIGMPQIAFNGRRAFVETPSMIIVQDSQLALGATTHARFLDQVERRAGRWAIVARHCSYDLSTFDFPRGPVPVNLAEVDAYPSEYAPLAYLLTTAGFPVTGLYPTRGSSLETTIRNDAGVWLAGKDDHDSFR